MTLDEIRPFADQLVTVSYGTGARSQTATGTIKASDIDERNQNFLIRYPDRNGAGVHVPFSIVDKIEPAK